MKKLFKILGIVLALLVITLFVLPVAFKGKIMEAVKTTANQQLRAHLDFDKVSLSFIRGFPDLSLEITQLSLTGTEAFSGDTLIFIPKLRVGIGLGSLLRNGPYDIKSVKLSEPFLQLKVLDEVRVNWDIARPEEASAGKAETPSVFKAKLRVMEVLNGRLIYDDATFPMRAVLSGLSIRMSGDLSVANSNLMAEVTANLIDVDYDGLRYLKKAKGQLSAMIGADLDNWKFTFEGARLRLNELVMTAAGFFAMPDQGYDMDIAFETEKNSFRSFLSLVPALYAKDFENLQAEGNMAFQGYVKGLYSETSLPGFGLDLQVNDAMFRYASLPEAVKNIELTLRVANNGSGADATVIDIPAFHFELGGNPVDLRLMAKTPVSDPYVDANLLGKLNLGDVSRFYPLDDSMTLSGILEANLKAKGNLSAIESGRYTAFDASGHFSVNNLNMTNSLFPKKLVISEALLNLSPSVAELPILRTAIGRNNLKANGKIENLMAYAFGKGELKGQLNISSDYFNANDFLQNHSQPESQPDSTAIGIIEVPAGVDFTLTASFAHLIYDKMDIHDLKGQIRVKDKIIAFKDVNMKALDGTLKLNGSYSTVVKEKPMLDFAMDVRDVDVKQAFLTFNTIEKLAPIAGLTSGKMSTQLELKTNLDGKMMPVFPTFNGHGNLQSPALTFNNVSSFNKLADALKIEKFRQWAIRQINLSFEMHEGKVFVKPFETNLGNTKAEISGWNSFDQTMEFVLQLNIPRAEFGGAANAVLDKLVAATNSKGVQFALNDMIPVTVLIAGTLTNPIITTNLKTTATNIADQMKQQLGETLQQKKDEAEAKLRTEADRYLAEAQQKAQNILNEAQKRADGLVKAAEETANSLRAEADKKTLQLLAEGKKNGPLAEIATKKAADKLQKEAGLQAEKVVAEARKQSDNLMQKAQTEANQLIDEAKSKTGTH
ncbi:AsmA-like C-terminal region-containing protein [Bacteroidales bacterium]